MHHQLATSFSSEGHRVLYVDNTGVRVPSIRRDFQRIARKIVETFSSNYGFRAATSNIAILSPILIPHPYNYLAVKINSSILVSKINKWMNADAASRLPLIIITFLPTPLSYQLCGQLRPDLLIYYCANDMAGDDPSKAPLIPWEKKLYAESDLVFTISAQLSRKAGLYSKRVYEFSPGLDNKFLSLDLNAISEPQELRSIPRPRVGFVGTLAPIDDRFDVQLFIDVVQQNPRLNFVLIGPSYGDITDLQAFSNVFILGPKKHEKLPSYLSSLDVAIIPYRVNEYTKSVSTCKLNEYLAVGLPVVTTPLSEIVRLSQARPGLFYLACTSDQFSVSLQSALVEKDDVNFTRLSVDRVEFAKSNSWDAKFFEINDLIERFLDSKACHQALLSPPFRVQEFISRLRVHKRHVLVLIGSAFTLCWLIFISPLVSAVAYWISPRDPLLRPSIAVVLTGDGSGSYYNDSFLNRAEDILHLYAKKKNVKIIISTARGRLITDVSVLKSFLTSRGIPESQITVLTPVAHTTWQHIRVLYNYLPSDYSGSIALFSSPLHARRAAAMLRKMAPAVSCVSAPSVVDTPQTPWKWWPSLTEIRVTSYELAAYAYAWLRGRV